MTFSTYAAARVLRVLPRQRITRAVGRLCDASLPAPVSRAVVSVYSRLYRVDLAEAELPKQGFASFDEFFTRPLRPGMRPAPADPDAVASPADGRLSAAGPVGHEGRFVVKGRKYTAGELIGDDAEAARYDGGQYAIVYLSPRDYHRVHSPVSGAVRVVRSMAGDLYPVNAIGEQHVPRLFAINRRVSVAIDTAHLGRVEVVFVGAMIVGRITLAHVDGRDVPIGVQVLGDAPEVARGDELGRFHMGSTVVLFFERGAPPITRELGPIRLGDALTHEAPPQPP